MALFSYDSKFSQVLHKIASGCYLNLLWIVCSLPIVTIGAATTALYYVTLKIADDTEGDITMQFVRSFRDNFRQATVIWLILVALGLVLGTDIYVLNGLRNSSTGAAAILWTLMLALVIAACIVYVIVALFVFPLLARVENTTPAMFRNALLIGMRYLNCTILVFAIHAAMLVVVVRLFSPLLLFAEGLCALASSYLFLPVLKLCTTEPADPDDPALEP